MEMNVKFDSIEEVLEFAKLFNGNNITNNCITTCKEICAKSCGDTEADSHTDTEAEAEKPKAKEEPKEEPKEKPKEEPKEEPITVEVTKVTVNDEEVPTLDGNAIVDKKPEVNETPVDIHTADAPKLFNTVMSVNETVRAEMMTGNITREALMAVGPKLAELNAALYEKFKDTTIDSKEATVAEIVRMINAGEALNLLG
ncbi:hypothetical protein [Lactococcus phage P087]|uniref:Uncharacterized protein n=1 Tax=Lactococcus phage P087 TaxID=641487 RepID=C3U2J3_9CAUD|nr:hypothetical protein P087_gp03 [Lactococcus phage P087]ACP41679.1 hypothetical protein [Lactococcus phage P087]